MMNFNKQSRKCQKVLKKKGAKVDINGDDGLSQLLSITFATKQVLVCTAEGQMTCLFVWEHVFFFFYCICFSCLHVCMGAIHQRWNPKQKSN